MPQTIPGSGVEILPFNTFKVIILYRDIRLYDLTEKMMKITVKGLTEMSKLM